MGLASQKAKWPGYGNWVSMNDRCHKVRHRAYRYYGARGIKVCEEWRGRGGYQRFIAHIGPKPSPLHEIDRIDSEGDYVPGNVRWATREENLLNRRRVGGLPKYGPKLPSKKRAASNATRNGSRGPSITRLVTLRGQKKTLFELAEIAGESYHTIRVRLMRGWTPEEAVSGNRPLRRTRARPIHDVMSKLAIGESALIAAHRGRLSHVARELGIKVSASLAEGGMQVTRRA